MQANKSAKSNLLFNIVLPLVIRLAQESIDCSVHLEPSSIGYQFLAPHIAGTLNGRTTIITACF